MFGTEDEYAKAISGATIHAYDNENRVTRIIGNFLFVSMFAATAYYGFKYYEPTFTKAIEKNNLVAAVSMPRPTAVLGVSYTPKVNDDYLIALNNMEVDILVDDKKVVENEVKERKVELDTTEQASLSSAMSLIMEDAMQNDESIYTQELNKEIKGEEKKNRVVVVKQGDTLASLSAKYYGDAMKYNKILASNAGSIRNDSRIYVGQKIKLPY